VLWEVFPVPADLIYAAYKRSDIGPFESFNASVEADLVKHTPLVI